MVDVRETSWTGLIHRKWEVRRELLAKPSIVRGVEEDWSVMLLAAEFELLNTQNVCGHIKNTISYVVRETAGSFMGSTLAFPVGI